MPRTNVKIFFLFFFLLFLLRLAVKKISQVPKQPTVFVYPGQFFSSHCLQTDGLHKHPQSSNAQRATRKRISPGTPPLVKGSSAAVPWRRHALPVEVGRTVLLSSADQILSAATCKYHRIPNILRIRRKSRGPS